MTRRLGPRCSHRSLRGNLDVFSAWRRRRRALHTSSWPPPPRCKHIITTLRPSQLSHALLCRHSAPPVYLSARAESWSVCFFLLNTKYKFDSNTQLDGCIVWNAHNTVLDEEAILIYIVLVCYVKTGRYGKPSNIITSLHRKKISIITNIPLIIS